MPCHPPLEPTGSNTAGDKETTLNIVGEIIWPDEPVLRDAEEWERNVRLVHLLCELGTVTKWQDGIKGRDGYVHMPYHYVVEDTTVEFLPHWGFIKIGGLNFDRPENREKLLQAIAALKAVVAAGLHT